LGQDWLSFAKAVASQVVQAIELARTLAQLRASEQRYRELVEGLDAIIWEADARTGHYTFISQRSEKILGYPPGDWLADPNFREKLIHPDDRERALAFWRTVLAEGRDQVLEYRVVADDGRVVWLHDTIRAIRDPAGNARQLRGVIVDITARKRVEAHEADLRLAREVQSRLFPKGGSPLAGFDVAGVSHPAEAAGGDYFDYIPMPDGCLGIVIGDVSGHGLASALLMAETRACLRALAMTRTDVGEILALLNRTLCDDIPEDYFITLLFARIDPRTRSLVYSSAGHTTGYILAASGVVKAVLDSTALPLGIYPQADFPSSPPFALSPGDQILFLTDGIVEASAPDGTLFGTERPLRMVRLSAHESAHFMVENLYHAVRAFTRNAPQLDDITAVIVRVGPEAVESV
jgi:sigma-B regulation protein RsbU (phosphoserine phosphatase)